MARANENQEMVATQTEGMAPMNRVITTGTWRKGYNNQLTGSQLVAIMNMREELGLPRISNSRIQYITMGAASQMIDDLMVLQDTFESLGLFDKKTRTLIKR